MARLISVSVNGWLTFGAGAINAGFVGVFLLGIWILMGLSPNGRFEVSGSSGSFGTIGLRCFLSGLAGGAGGGGSGASIGGFLGTTGVGIGTPKSSLFTVPRARRISADFCILSRISAFCFLLLLSFSMGLRVIGAGVCARRDFSAKVNCIDL